MRVSTPSGLKYPITVTKLLVEDGQAIEENAALFSYRYRGTIPVYDKDKGEDVPRESDFFAEFETDIVGTVTALEVDVGQVMRGPTEVANILEDCKHEVQFGGMCANCGKDMNEVTYSTTSKNTERATINTVHGHTKLLVSQEEASRADNEAKTRLIKARKLSLVVDLDQTIIHATVDPTVAEWQGDEKNPNHEAVKHVKKFQLVDDGPGARGTWYYIKLRPGLAEFLQTVSQRYELHIYTMATRAYAEEIAKLVDPDRKLFANRILSRDENGSMSSKNLRRLFPVDTKMVVIIDDRGDVWSWSPNLVKVQAYDFFVGIGDINSSFLPKRPELEARPPKPTKAEAAETEATLTVSDESSSEAKSGGDSSKASKATTPSSTPPATNGDVSAVDRMVSMAGSQDAGSLKEKTEEQDETIAAQLADRPLLQKQKILDQAEEEAKTSPAAEAAAELLAGNGETKELEAGEDTTPPPKYRHNLLQDDDNELEYLGQGLCNIHQAYFDQYEKENPVLQDTRVSELRPGRNSGKKRPADELELENIPDAAQIMASMKTRVLAGVNIVFSGIVPIGVDIQNHDISIWAKSFGATVSDNIGKRTTHLIASPDRRTAKVRQAAKKGGRIAIVNQNWLFASFSQWRRVDEGPYREHLNTTANGKASGLPDSFETREYMLSSSDEEAAQTDEETDGTVTPTNGTAGRRSGLRLDMDATKDGETDDELAVHSPTVRREDSRAAQGQEEEDWSEIMGEIDELSGSDPESDTESVRTDSTIPSDGLITPPSRGSREEKSTAKRKRDALAEESELGGVPAGDGENGESRLQKRKKEAISRTTSLTNVATAPSSHGSTPQQTSVDPGGGSQEVGPDDAAEDDDDDLEAQLAAAMEGPGEE